MQYGGPPSNAGSLTGKMSVTSSPSALIANVPEPIATQLLSDAHTKGPHRLLDLDSPATVKLIGDAYNKGSPCGTVEVVHFLQKRDSYTTVE